MTLRNIHFAVEEDSAPEPEPLGSRLLAPGTPPRLRDVTNDPLREYRSRPGQVAPLSDAVASLILSRKGARVVENHQIIAAVDGVERAYSSPDSLVIAEMNGRGIKVYWVANRRRPDCIHLVTKNGEYLETLPLKGQPAWFSDDEESRAALAAAASHRKRDARRLAELHGPDIAAAAEREAHNAEELAKKVREDERMVRVFAGSDQSSVPSNQSPKAQRICAVEEAVDAARTRRAQTPAVDLVAETLRGGKVVARDVSEDWA